jgi:hypothetical protein
MCNVHFHGQRNNLPIYLVIESRQYVDLSKKNYSTPNPKILWSNNHFPYCHFGSIPIFQTHPCQSTWCHCALPTPHGHAGHATHLCRKCSLGCVGRLETSA